MTVPLLVLRPQPDAAATAARAGALGLEPVTCPLFEAVAVDWSPPGGMFDAVMMTSAQAARRGGAGLGAYTGLPLYAVGEATAAAAREAGFATVLTGTSGVDALLAQIAADGRARVLHFAGRETTAHRAPAFEVIEVVTYAVDPLPPPELPARAVALLHSARAAARFATLATDRSAFDLVAIGPRAAQAAGSGWRSLCWADTPDDAAMLALAAPLCEN